MGLGSAEDLAGFGSTIDADGLVSFGSVMVTSLGGDGGSFEFRCRRPFVAPTDGDTARPLRLAEVPIGRVVGMGCCTTSEFDDTAEQGA